MPRRTQIFQQIPWLGGLNTSVEPGVLPQQDLVINDNVQLLASGVKTKREGLEYWDELSDVPAVVKRSSSGTTRTLVFASALTSASIDKLVVGEEITITGNANYNGTGVAITAISTTDVTNDTLTYTLAGSYSETITTASDITVVRSNPIVEIVDYWYFNGSSQVQKVVAITKQPLIFYYDSSGRRKKATIGTITARVAESPRVCAIMMNEKLLVFQEAIGNVPLKYDGTTVDDLAASAPDASIATTYLSRVWCNDKEAPDRLHYSATGTIDTWGGTSDSGAIDIRPGDGDSEGITAIFSFKGRLFVAKKNRLFQVIGDSPENFQVSEVSSGLGIASDAAVAAVDQNDVIYMSPKGVHSIATTDAYGDFTASFLSAKIQPSFNDWETIRYKYTQAVYVPTLNSVVFNVSEQSTTAQDNLWLYNVEVKEWYRWPNIDAQALGTIYLDDRLILFIGTSDGKLIRAQNGTKVDFDSTAIRYRIKTGTIYPDGSPITTKAFKRLTLFFKPKSSYSFIARVKIDGFAEQTLGFSGVAQGDRLGIDFVLGSSILGTDLPFAPRTVMFDGYGHGVTIDIEQSGTGEDVDVYGFALEYEVADFTEEGGASNDGGE